MKSSALTPRQIECLKLYAEGMNIKTMADTLKVKPHTIDWHLQSIKDRLGVKTSQMLVHAALALGIASLAFKAELHPVAQQDYAHD